MPKYLSFIYGQFGVFLGKSYATKFNLYDIRKIGNYIRFSLKNNAKQLYGSHGPPADKSGVLLLQNANDNFRLLFWIPEADFLNGVRNQLMLVSLKGWNTTFKQISSVTDASGYEYPLLQPRSSFVTYASFQ